MAKARRKRPSKIRPPVAEPSAVRFNDILERLRASERPFSEELLRQVHEFSKEMHVGQVRRSGEPYVTHPLQVAAMLADWRFDATCVSVGLLHDVLEDTLTTRTTLEEKFGAEIAELVDGVTKIGRHEYIRRDQAQAETFRKLILASVKDIRVIIVKLADRLHNMMTLGHMPAESSRRISQETLEIYAPIALRLGMSKVQRDLADQAFYYLYPHQFAALHDKLREKVKLGRDATEAIRSSLVERLAESGVEADISSRAKGYYSIYRKLRRQGIDISELYDYLAFRIITPSVKDCYAALGVVHQSWRPVPGRFKDYIAMPKPNLYQSLHTSLVGPNGQPFEIQIRTREMDRVAEEGIAAHWRYKESPAAPEASGDKEAENTVWLRQLLDWQQEVDDPRAFLTALKVDLYPDEVYAFTPKGDVKAFPRGATPLDFAYRIHTDVGHRCVGARVNGQLVPLRTPFRNGDIIEILTSKTQKPSRDWLNWVQTSRAKSKIRNWLNTEQKQAAMEIGRRMLERELRRIRMNPKKVLESAELADYLSREGFARPEDMLSRIGFGKLAPRSVLEKVVGEEKVAATQPRPGRFRDAVHRILPFGGGAIRVKGHSDLLAYLAKCCNPLPGEEIVGYVTRGRGVSVHAADCPNVQNLLYHPEREIEVEWARQADEVFPIALRVRTEDEPGILAGLTEIIAKHDSNIRQIEADTGTGRGSIDLVVEIRDRRHLERIRRDILSMQGVLEVDRKSGAADILPEPS